MLRVVQPQLVPRFPPPNSYIMAQVVADSFALEVGRAIGQFQFGLVAMVNSWQRCGVRNVVPARMQLSSHTETNMRLYVTPTSGSHYLHKWQGPERMPFYCCQVELIRRLQMNSTNGWMCEKRSGRDRLSGWNDTR